MSKPIITAENLGKAYRLGAKLDKNATFRDAIIGRAEVAAEKTEGPHR